MRRTQAQHTDPAQQRSSAAAAAYAGVDVSKDHLDLSVVGADGAPLPGLPGLPGAARHRRIANTPAGVRGLCAVLRDVAGADGTGLALVVLEATGAYHAPLLAALCGARLPVAVANPAQVKAYRQTLLGRNKTDRADALLLARFARAHGAVLVRYAPPPDEQRHLRQVLAYREQLATRRTALANQLDAARLLEEVVGQLAQDGGGGDGVAGDGGAGADVARGAVSAAIGADVAEMQLAAGAPLDDVLAAVRPAGVG